jgi:protein gp37
MCKRGAANPTLRPERRAAYAGGPPWFDKTALDAPLHWRKPQVVATQFMGDLFHPSVSPVMVDRVLEVVAATPQHVYLALSKRPENMARMMYGVTSECPCRELGGGDYLPNLWLGVSAENPLLLALRLRELEELQRQAPGIKTWLSLEPLLDQIILPREMLRLAGVRQVVVGCESGPGHRPCPRWWVRQVVQDCAAIGVPCYVKQINIVGRCSHDPAEWPADLRVRELAWKA